MAKKLYLNVLWHMHQPYYKNDDTGRYEMPWVFLHAIKDYYDLPWYLSAFPSLKATFNLVPSLLVQLQEYESPEVNDKLLNLLRVEVDDLTGNEKRYLLEILFYAQKETMIEPIARYAELYRKMDQSDKAGERLNVLTSNEFLDLEVCFLLAWCGIYLRTNSNLVRSLLTKRTFSHSEKVTLLEELTVFVKGITPFYKELEEKGQIEISATPFYHPIMPLLMDSQNGKRANPDTLMPKTAFSFAADAQVHVQDALAYHSELFGRRPKGMWPSEGSVDETSLDIYIKEGVEWVCTDEEILYKSLGAWEKENIFKRHRFKNRAGEVSVMFRDRSLSDAIGFDFSRMDPDMAAKNFIGRLRQIFDKNKNSVSVNVILDGENAWEYYRNNAHDFFHALYRHLSTSDWIVTQTMSEAALNADVAQDELIHVAPGSWINGDFGIWIGQEEKNRAWDLLAMTIADAHRQITGVDKNVARKIQKEIMIAQGSDWFWWFGDTHFTAQKAEFDALFRSHLITVYRLLGLDVPAVLNTPIIKLENKGIHILPKNPITVLIDGEKSSFFEWMGAGEFNLEKMGGAMDSSTPYAKKLLYGSDDSQLSFCLIGEFSPLLKISTVEISFGEKLYAAIPFDDVFRDDIVMACSQEFIEVGIPKKRINGDRLDLRIKITQGDDIRQIIPFHGTLNIELRNRYPDHWFI